MDIIILERKMRMTSISVFKILTEFYKKCFTYLYCIFWVLSCFMVSHIQITVKGDNNTEIICLCLFVIYLLWYIYYPKNKYLYSIPLFLYIIGYYIIHWDSICEVTKVLWNGIFG